MSAAVLELVPRPRRRLRLALRAREPNAPRKVRAEGWAATEPAKTGPTDFRRRMHLAAQLDGRTEPWAEGTAARIRKCGDYTVRTLCGGCETAFGSSNRPLQCGHRTLCGRCARKWSLQRTDMLRETLRAELEEQRGSRVRLLTITVKVSGDLRADVLRLHRALTAIAGSRGPAGAHERRGSVEHEHPGAGSHAAWEVGAGGNVHVHLLHIGPHAVAMDCSHHDAMSSCLTCRIEVKGTAERCPKCDAYLRCGHCVRDVLMRETSNSYICHAAQLRCDRCLECHRSKGHCACAAPRFPRQQCAQRRCRTPGRCLKAVIEGCKYIAPMVADCEPDDLARMLDVHAAFRGPRQDKGWVAKTRVYGSLRGRMGAKASCLNCHGENRAGVRRCTRRQHSAACDESHASKCERETHTRCLRRCECERCNEELHICNGCGTCLPELRWRIARRVDEGVLHTSMKPAAAMSRLFGRKKAVTSKAGTTVENGGPSRRSVWQVGNDAVSRGLVQDREARVHRVRMPGAELLPPRPEAAHAGALPYVRQELREASPLPSRARSAAEAARESGASSARGVGTLLPEVSDGRRAAGLPAGSVP